MYKKFNTIIQAQLIVLSNTILAAIPNALNTISFTMPTYKINGRYLVYFAGNKNDVGFYAASTRHDNFKKPLTIYKQSKSSVQFTINNKLLLQGITQFIKFRE